jgi:RimJ/RimL family protein N-acetyltransferase
VNTREGEFDHLITFREVEFDKDVARLHEWHHKPHVIPFWQQNFPYDQYQIHLKKLLADTHQTLYIGELDGIPMCYWESYWASDDAIANYYDADETDQGIHLLIGPECYLGKGLSLPILRAMTAYQFTEEQTMRIVAEPDIRNKKMIHVFKKCGFTPIKEIDLPDKKGLLMVCEREVFFRRWKDVPFRNGQCV